jgi:hypothetical protein
MPEPVEQQEAQVDDSGAMSFEDAMKAALVAGQDQDIEPQTEENTLEPAVEDATPPEPPVEAAEQLQAPEAVAAPAVEPVAPGEADKSLQKIMERESALLAREQAYEESKGQIEDLRSRLAEFSSTQNNFNLDPVSYIRSLAPEVDLKRLAETLWYENQGLEAPPKYLEQKAATRQNTALAERIAKIEKGEAERMAAQAAAQQQQEAQQSFERYQGALGALASEPGEAFPLMAEMAKADRQSLDAEMIAIARSHAINTGGEVLTPEQVASVVEKRLSVYRPNTQATQAPTPTAEQGTSLRNQSTQIQPDREPEDPYSDEYLERKALKAAGII